MDIIYRKYDDLLQLVLSEADPRSRHWLLVNDSPIYVWICTLCYLVFVLWLGPKLMRHREPFVLRPFMIVYNSFLVLLSLYMVVEIMYSFYLNDYHPICQPFNSKTAHLKPMELRMAKALWWYFFSKVIEFTDTVLMVLRKKDSQITFLHVFHHASMLNIWWFTIILIPGGQGWLASSLNSFVHVIMYSYYLFNLFPSLRPYLWWKKYITQLQLTQFVIILVHTCNTYISGCDFPVWSVFMLAAYMFIMIFLFGNFYIKSYLNKPKKSQLNGNHSSMSNGKVSSHSKSNGKVE